MNWWVRLRSFLSEVRGELKRSSWPSGKEVRGTTAVVVVTVFIFALFLWIVDIALSNMVDWVFKHAAG